MQREAAVAREDGLGHLRRACSSCARRAWWLRRSESAGRVGNKRDGRAGGAVSGSLGRQRSASEPTEHCRPRRSQIGRSGGGGQTASCSDFHMHDVAISPQLNLQNALSASSRIDGEDCLQSLCSRRPQRVGRPLLRPSSPSRRPRATMPASQSRRRSPYLVRAIWNALINCA